MTPIRVRNGNVIAIPSDLADGVGIAPGQEVFVYRLGGTLSIRPKASPLRDACDEFEALMREEGVTLDELLEGLAEERGKGASTGEGV